MKNRILIATLITATTILSGCFNFGSDNPDTGTTGESKTYETTEYALEIPKDWEVISKDKFTSEVPNDSQIVFRNNIKSDAFTANTVIVKRTVNSNESSLEFAKKALNNESSSLTDYKETRRETYSLKIGDQTEDTYIAYFEAKKSASEPLTKYIQTYGVRGTSGFIVTGAFSPEEEQNTVQKVENIIKSFRLK